MEQRYEEAQVLNEELESTNRALEAARAEAVAANQSKMDFLSAMSHELRTPLNAIAGYVDLMELGIHGPVTDQQRRGLERIRRNQAHLLTLINDILNFAKLEAGRVELQMRDEAMHETLAGIEALVEPQVRARGLTYTYHPCDPELTAWVDRERLLQILLNLVSNAIKFTEPGGWVTLACEADGDFVRVEVRDSGIGIPADKQGKIFDPFVQAHRSLNSDSRMGVGLGLTISRDLAAAMGGSLSVESLEGEGSIFVLTIPRASADAH